MWNILGCIWWIQIFFWHFCPIHDLYYLQGSSLHTWLPKDCKKYPKETHFSTPQSLHKYKKCLFVCWKGKFCLANRKNNQSNCNLNWWDDHLISILSFHYRCIHFLRTTQIFIRWSLGIKCNRWASGYWWFNEALTIEWLWTNDLNFCWENCS